MDAGSREWDNPRGAPAHDGASMDPLPERASAASPALTGRFVAPFPSAPPTVALALALALLAAWTAVAAPAAAQQDVRDVLGVTHVAGRYNFTGEDFLGEGADQLLALGTRVIKVWL